MFSLLLGVVVGAIILTSTVPSPKIVSKSWSSEDLGKIASENAIRFTLGTFHQKVVHEWKMIPRPTKEVVDLIPTADLRNTLLREVGWSTSLVEAKAAEFAGAIKASATCTFPGSAGVDGLNACVLQCEQGTASSLNGEPKEGACYFLCSLAVAPCHGRPFTWTAWWKTTKRSFISLLHSLARSVILGCFAAMSLMAATRLKSLMISAAAHRSRG